MAYFLSLHSNTSGQPHSMHRLASRRVCSSERPALYSSNFIFNLVSPGTCGTSSCTERTMWVKSSGPRSSRTMS